MLCVVTILILIDGFLQLIFSKSNKKVRQSHNPYFNRWFSAIYISQKYITEGVQVTILILIDGFLQFIKSNSKNQIYKVSQSLF